MYLWYLYTFLLISKCAVEGELAVRVKTGAGNLVAQTIQEDLDNNIIELSFIDFDYTTVTQLIDFKHGVQIFHISLLGELELGQPNYVGLCFITGYTSQDFIDVEAMWKLRQKNPSVVRIADEHLGSQYLLQDMKVNVDRSAVISPHISRLCENAKDSTFTREADLVSISKATQRSLSSLLTAATRLPTFALPRCSSIPVHPFKRNDPKSRSACSCQYQFSVDWYPCDLRTCRGYNEENEVISYRCGIKSCAVTRVADFPVTKRETCMWE